MKDFIKVALTSEKDRYQTVFRALDLLKDEIDQKIGQLSEKDDYILIKPNCFVTGRPLAVTHREALKALLDFLAPLWSGKIILAEGSGIGNTLEAFKNFGYLNFKKDFPKIEFLDLNYANAIFIDIFDQNLERQTVKIANTVSEAKMRISLGPPKTHDSTIVTLSIKNMAVGSMLKEDKERFSHTPQAINRSLAEINKYTFPHLAVIDGWQGMEGDGPVSGQPVESRFAIVSMNALAADTLATKLMGFNPLQIGYLNYLGAGNIKDKIEVKGEEPTKFQCHFRPPRTYLEQIQWS